MRKRTILVAVAILTLLTAQAAWAQRALGPVNPANGYPSYVQDEFGVQLDLPVPPYGDGVTAPTMIFDPVITGNSVSEAAGFGTEAFFFLANSTISLPNGGSAILVLGIEAAYGSGTPDPANPPDQMVFSRVRVRFDAAVAGPYTVTHPWGAETLVLTVADVGTRFNHVFDWGGFAPSPLTSPVIPSSFERVLISPKPWRFLQATTKVVQVPGEEAYIIGDGVTLTTVSGGFNAVNSFTIVGPANAFGTGVNTVATTLFTVSGHIFGQPIPTTVTPPPPATTDTVTITRARLKNQNLEVRATSSNGFPMTAEALNAAGTVVGSGNLGTSGRAIFTVIGTPTQVRVHSTSTNPAILGGTDIKPIPFP